MESHFQSFRLTQYANRRATEIKVKQLIKVRRATYHFVHRDDSGWDSCEESQNCVRFREPASAERLWAERDCCS